MPPSEVQKPVASSTTEENKEKKRPNKKPKPKTTQESGSTAGVVKKESSSSVESEEQQKETRKPISEADLERYNSYVGQKWTGVCKWFNVSKGFGFVIPDNEEAKQHGDEVFSVLIMDGFRSLGEDEAIEFKVRLGKRGLEAEEVVGVGGAEIRGHTVRPKSKKEKTFRRFCFYLIQKLFNRCFNCGQVGFHKASKCPHPPSKEKSCYHCGSTEHMMADCPEPVEKRTQHKQQKFGKKVGQNRPKPAAPETTTPKVKAETK